MDDRSKRIAKNTLMLYGRTFVTMLIGLYTGRLTLEALGIDNYGIQNVVGSIVAFSSLITGAMSAAGSRFITYALGEGNIEKMKSTFTTTVNVQLMLGLLIVIVMEIAGVWFLNNEANIPNGRIYAANWVLQTSIISLLLGLISSPFNATIIAHEKMSIYAYVGIIEIIINLFIVIYILHYAGDRLIMISNLRLICYIFIFGFYLIYCKRNFKEVDYTGEFNWADIKEIFSFSSWSFIGNATWVFNTQGINMLINIFFGVAYNAARGVAATVNGCIQSFVSNFTMAFTPQITKSYAAREYDYCYMIVNRGTKFSLLLQIIFIVPVFMEAETILHLWLTDVPPLATLFLQLTLFESLSLSLSGSLIKLIRANGFVKRIVLKTSCFSFLVFPTSWIAFKCGMPVWSTYPIMICIYTFLIIFYLNEASRLTSYKWITFIKNVIIPCFRSLVLSFIVPTILYLTLNQTGIIRFIILSPINIIWTIIIIYKFGLDKREKDIVNTKIKQLVLTRIPVIIPSKH